MASILSVKPNTSTDSWKWGDVAQMDFFTGYVRLLLQNIREGDDGYQFRCNDGITYRLVSLWLVEMLHFNPICVFFGSIEESVDYLFISCELTMIVWAKIISWYRIRSVFAISFWDLMEIPYSLRGLLLGNRFLLSKIWYPGKADMSILKCYWSSEHLELLILICNYFILTIIPHMIYLLKCR